MNMNADYQVEDKEDNKTNSQPHRVITSTRITTNCGPSSMNENKDKK